MIFFILCSKNPYFFSDCTEEKRMIIQNIMTGLENFFWFGF